MHCRGRLLTHLIGCPRWHHRELLAAFAIVGIAFLSSGCFVPARNVSSHLDIRRSGIVGKRYEVEHSLTNAWGDLKVFEPSDEEHHWQIAPGTLLEVTKVADYLDPSGFLFNRSTDCMFLNGPHAGQRTSLDRVLEKNQLGVRAAACIGVLGPPNTAADGIALVDQLRSPDWATRFAAAESIRIDPELEDDVIGPLILPYIVGHEDPDVRYRLLCRLKPGMVGDHIEQLLDLLAHPLVLDPEQEHIRDLVGAQGAMATSAVEQSLNDLRGRRDEYRRLLMLAGIAARIGEDAADLVPAIHAKLKRMKLPPDQAAAVLEEVGESDPLGEK